MFQSSVDTLKTTVQIVNRLHGLKYLAAHWTVHVAFNLLQVDLKTNLQNEYTFQSLQ